MNGDLSVWLARLLTLTSKRGPTISHTAASNLPRKNHKPWQGTNQHPVVDTVTRAKYDEMKDAYREAAELCISTARMRTCR